MHVLMTSDTLNGSIWTYTRELITGLIGRGMRVTLVSFGEIPLPAQTAWMERLRGLEYRPTAFAWTGCTKASRISRTRLIIFARLPRTSSLISFIPIIFATAHCPSRFRESWSRMVT